MSKNPMLALAASFALGMALARPGCLEPVHAAAEISTVIPILLAATAFCLLIGLVVLRAECRRAATLLALVGFVLAGASAARLFELRFPPDHVSHLAESELIPNEPVVVTGRISSTPVRASSGLQFDLELSRLRIHDRVRSASGRVQLHLDVVSDPTGWAAATALALDRGDLVRAPAILRRPHVYHNPGSFDFRRWMESIEDLYWVGNIRSASEVEKLPDALAETHLGFPGRIASSASTALERTHQRLLHAIDRLYPPWLPEGRDGAVLKAVLVGDRTALDSDTVESFRKAGLYHLLVIAGLHVGLLAMLVAGLLRWLRLREPWRSFVVLAFLLLFASLVEQRAPTLRATLMISVYLVARLLWRERQLLNSVGLAALLLLLWRPGWLEETGFQLSFAAALLIAGLAVPVLERTTEPYRRGLAHLDAVDLDPSIEPRVAQFRLDLRSLIQLLERRWAFLESHAALAAALVKLPVRAVVWAANMLLFSAILQLGLMLPMAETFHRITFAGIGLNALAIPVMTVLLAVAVPTVILAAVAPSLAVWPAKLVALIMKGLFALAVLPHLPAWLSYRVPEPPAWVAWGFALAILATAIAFEYHSRALAPAIAASGVFLVLICLHPFAPRLPSGAFEVTMLDCGGGNSLFIVLPDRTTILEDACGGRTTSIAFASRRWDPGEEIVSPYLWSRGVKKLDVLVVGNSRDAAGMAAVVRNFRVAEIWRGASPLANSGPSDEEFFEAADERHVPLRRLAAGERVSFGPSSIEVLSPAASDPDDNSIHTRQAKARGATGENSLALRILNLHGSLLLPAEMSSAVEGTLVNSSAALASQLLQVPRHGAESAVTSDFLARVSPRIALISTAGTGSRYSPSPETLDGLGSFGVRVFRTDRDGAVTVEMRGGVATVRTFVQGH